MTTFRFITVGENLGTRKLGEETRNKLLLSCKTVAYHAVGGIEEKDDVPRAE